MDDDGGGDIMMVMVMLVMVMLIMLMIISSIICKPVQSSFCHTLLLRV